MPDLSRTCWKKQTRNQEPWCQEGNFLLRIKYSDSLHGPLLLIFTKKRWVWKFMCTNGRWHAIPMGSWFHDVGWLTHLWEAAKTTRGGCRASDFGSWNSSDVDGQIVLVVSSWGEFHHQSMFKLILIWKTWWTLNCDLNLYSTSTHPPPLKTHQNSKTLHLWRLGSCQHSAWHPHFGTPSLPRS